MTQPPSPVELFASIARPSQFRDYLVARRDEMYRLLTVEQNVVRIHQAQGKLHLIDEQLKLLDQATHLR